MTAPGDGVSVGGADGADGRAVGLGLREHHRRMLVGESAILPEIVAERGYYTCEKKVDLRGRGYRSPEISVPGLMIPIHNVFGEVAWHQYRPDRPRLRDGKLAKYEMPPGVGMVLDVHPRCLADLADPRAPLLVTEGVRKGDSAVSRGICTVTLLGVWNWRGSNERGGKTALADWEQVALNGRKVYLCFDSDVMQKLPVYRALARLWDMLRSRGADTRVIYLDADADGDDEAGEGV